MFDLIISNGIYVTLITIFVTIIPLLICGHHYKKYGFIEGLFSLLTIPILFCGIFEIVIKIFENNNDVVIFIKEITVGLFIFKHFYVDLLSYTNVEWLYNTAWCYMPIIILFILVYGYSITFYRRKKRAKDNQ